LVRFAISGPRLASLVNKRRTLTPPSASNIDPTRNEHSNDGSRKSAMLARVALRCRMGVKPCADSHLARPSRKSPAGAAGGFRRAARRSSRQPASSRRISRGLPPHRRRSAAGVTARTEPRSEASSSAAAWTCALVTIGSRIPLPADDATRRRFAGGQRPEGPHRRRTKRDGKSRKSPVAVERIQKTPAVQGLSAIGFGA
jgi:hypothetical protein